MDGKKILLGRITGAHGIKGEVMIRAYTETPQGLIDYGALDGGDGRRIVVTHARATNKGVIARIAGVEDRTAAEKLKGIDLHVDRSRMPDADEGSYYLVDLIGLAAVDTAGATIGRVTAVENYGAGDILVVALAEGGEVMVPFRDAFVPVVDVKGGRVTIVVPQMVGEPEPKEDGDGESG